MIQKRCGDKTQRKKKTGDVDKMISLYREGKTNKEIAEIMGICKRSTSRITRTLKKHLGDEYQKFKNSRKLNDERVRAVRILLDKGMTC